MLVVNEPELAEAISRLRGEWAERFGGELTTAAIEWEKLIEQNAVAADVIVFPSRYLGELCVRDWLRPVRPHVLESEEFDATDIFPLVRLELMRWGDQVMALPLGIDPSAIRQERAKHPAVAFLSEAASETMSDNREGVLFDPQTMSPRIAESAFVRALERLQPGNDDRPPDSVANAPIPLLGFADQLIAVTSASRNAASAFKLITWLAQPDISSQIARAKGGMLPVRQSLASSPSWYGPGLSAEERATMGEALEQMLGAQQCFLIPRIPGVDDYLAALAEAVNTATEGKSTRQEALQQAAERWEEITEAHGRDVQREAYLKHLGIDD